jgi:hypothetical protein
MTYMSKGLQPVFNRHRFSGGSIRTVNLLFPHVILFNKGYANSFSFNEGVQGLY